MGESEGGGEGGGGDGVGGGMSFFYFYFYFLGAGFPLRERFLDILFFFPLGAATLTVWGCFVGLVISPVAREMVGCGMFFFLYRNGGSG